MKDLYLRKEDHDDTNDNGKQLEHEHVLHRRRGDGASEFLKSARREGSRERRGEEQDTRRRRRRRNRYPDRGRRGKGKRRDGVDIDSDERMMKRVDKHRDRCLLLKPRSHLEYFKS